jgi:hypothetical protein
MARTTAEIAEAAAEQIVRNCGDIRVLNLPQFVERVSPVIEAAIEEALKEQK